MASPRPPPRTVWLLEPDFAFRRTSAKRPERRHRQFAAEASGRGHRKSAGVRSYPWLAGRLPATPVRGWPAAPRLQLGLGIRARFRPAAPFLLGGARTP